MTLPRNDIINGLSQELSAFSSLVRPLTAEELDTPTRCEGWTVRDVAAHVSSTMHDVVAGDFDGMATPEGTERRVRARSAYTGTDLADEIDAANAAGQDLLGSFDDGAWEGPAPAGLATTIGAGVEALWYDAFVHADDIRHALGRPSLPAGEVIDSLRAGVSHLAYLLEQQDFGPATLRLDGIPALTVSGGSDDRTVTGDPMAFVLAGTGRIDPASIGLDETVNVYRS